MSKELGRSDGSSTLQLLLQRMLQKSEAAKDGWGVAVVTGSHQGNWGYKSILMEDLGWACKLTILNIFTHRPSLSDMWHIAEHLITAAYWSWERSPHSSWPGEWDPLRSSQPELQLREFENAFGWELAPTQKGPDRSDFKSLFYYFLGCPGQVTYSPSFRF